ncbi:DUF1365 domain-containing protein [Gilvimarinus sp. 1_MG-2023]|uniref:DUF1365 domain-containing protein n=1 Tax=Gilvimarinus sp. 1_MG-2023 TaxID=3062638 RepID=UPI0026E2670E|nr:DUF1365 domain-containing protein [Gilvimarinus sp. 1_MG-2023]MDO6745867.1 DUF1365 domain-containing protein [Gilvimarinus sp. 1_MG-2023]
MTLPDSAVYTGIVRHRRFYPVVHEFSYSITLFLLNLDEIDQLMAQSRWFSCRHWSLAQFRRSDYMAPHHQDLKSIAVSEVEKALLCTVNSPKVYLLSNIRQWGFCFNPVSFYYVFDTEELVGIVAEVNNTPWKERHRYVVNTTDQVSPYQYHFAKRFHVSPFNPLTMDYRWQSNEPGQSIDIHMENWQSDIKHMDATLSLQKKSWSSAHLNRALIRTPFNTIKVPLLIYWQAIKLWWKKAPIYDHQPVDK